MVQDLHQSAKFPASLNSIVGWLLFDTKMKRFTPQEKKRLSYDRDRRNCYGESPHASRKSIPLNKALRNRANRRLQNQPLDVVQGRVNLELAEEVESQIKHRAPKVWKKYPDAPLGKVVARKLNGRGVMQTQGGRQALITVLWKKIT